jgi:hypothetical protein
MQICGGESERRLISNVVPERPGAVTSIARNGAQRAGVSSPLGTVSPVPAYSTVSRWIIYNGKGVAKVWWNPWRAVTVGSKIAQVLPIPVAAYLYVNCHIDHSVGLFGVCRPTVDEVSRYLLDILR